MKDILENGVVIELVEYDEQSIYSVLVSVYEEYLEIEEFEESRDALDYYEMMKEQLRYCTEEEIQNMLEVGIF